MVFNIADHFREIPVLDHGHVALIDGMAQDPKLKVVNAARVSFGKQSSELSAQDEKLISYLYTHGHLSTYRHSYFSVRIKAPLFVLRQWWKTQTGSHWLESVEIPDNSWNEISGRYVDLSTTEFHVPTEMRLQSKSNKQGSEGVHPDSDALRLEFLASCQHSVATYKSLVGLGVAKEVARQVLPQGMYSEVVWTFSLQTAITFLSQRLKSDAQLEIRMYAQAVQELLGELLPKVNL